MGSLAAAIAWYFALLVTGWIAFPLAYRLLPALPDRGYALSRALGLLLWGYFFWLLASLHLAFNTPGGILTALSVVALLSLSVAWPRRVALKRWLRDHKTLILWEEALFLVAFGLWVYVRGCAPEAVGTEKPMELAFINAILRSPTFPPHDPWLSGYAISYYYFGYVMVAMLARLLGIGGTIAFNLGLSTVFALTVVGAFGLVYDLARPRHPAPALLGPLFVAVTGNWEGLLEIFHARGWFSPTFWRWLDIKDLANPPQPPPAWAPQRFWWWWRASRVVTDHNLAGAVQEVIDEFPFFSYLLGDLHPHVLAYPFALLAIGLALNLYLGGSRRVAAPRLRLMARPAALPKRPSAWRLHHWLMAAQVEIVNAYRRASRAMAIAPASLALAALALGGMAFLNTWDFPIYVGLFAAAYAARQARWQGWKAQLKPFIGLGIALGLSGGLLYLPFYVGFSSQAGGILPNLINPTRGAQLWVMFGPLLVPLFLWIGAEIRSQKVPVGKSLLVGLEVALGFFGLAWLLGWLIVALLPLGGAKGLQASQAFLGVNGAGSSLGLLAAAFKRHLGSPWGTLTVAAILGLAWGLLSTPPHATRPRRSLRAGFPWLLVLFGALLVLTPNFIYLRDQFGTRMNTVFKFYYQGWLMWGLAAAYGVIWLMRRPTRWQPLFTTACFVALAAGLVYPSLALPSRTNNFHPVFGWTLDAGAYLARQSPDEWAAIQVLRRAPLGTVAEAVGGSYTQYARISTYTGLPTVLGWPGHESQWRGGAALFAGRENDIATLYTTHDWATAAQIITTYHIRYIVVAPLERNTYHVDESKFHQHLPVYFQQGEVTIYLVP